MNSQRRRFMQACGAASAMMLPGLAGASRLPGPDAHSSAGPSSAQIEKSIKAGFGGGFSVRSHRCDGRLVHADIQHAGTCYRVVSQDLFDWHVVATTRA